jgi:hypothetical protein
LLPSPGNPGEGWVRVYRMNAIRPSNIVRTNPHPDLLPEYREKEKCAHAIALHEIVGIDPMLVNSPVRNDTVNREAT